jgi:mannose-6-phosphate isomerase
VEIVDTTEGAGGRTAGPSLMDNPVRRYDWGSRHALSRLQGRLPDGDPEAELWMGAHPLAPSGLVDADGRPVALADAITGDPVWVLGPDVLVRFGERLPFLLKVLAIGRALSIQVHPDPVQAARGFAEDEAAGLSRTDPRRRYADPYPKPEQLVALTHVWALAGLRETHRAGLLLDLLDLRDLDGTDGLAGVRQAMRLSGRVAGTVAAIAVLCEYPAPDRRAFVGAVRSAVRQTLAAGRVERDPQLLDAMLWVLRLAEQHPADPMVLAPLLLDLHLLEPGETIYLPAGVPHAYLSGVGVEIMCASDNVVRAGLTSKRVDVDALLEMIDPAGRPLLDVPRQRLSDHETVWRPPVAEFQLSRIMVGPGSPRPDAAVPASPLLSGPQVLLCLTGEVEVRTPGHSVRLRGGQSAFIPAAAPAPLLLGRGEVYRAAVGARMDVPSMVRLDVTLAGGVPPTAVDLADAGPAHAVAG